MDVGYVFNNLVNALIPIGICVVLPIIVVGLITRERINRDNMRKDIILAAMEKNADIDVEEMMKKLNGPKKLLKEKLMMKLLIGSILVSFSILVYVAMAVYIWIYEFNEQMFIALSFAAVPSLAIGIAFLINYFSCQLNTPNSVRRTSLNNSCSLPYRYLKATLKLPVRYR